MVLLTRELAGICADALPPALRDRHNRRHRHRTPGATPPIAPPVGIEAAAATLRANGYPRAEVAEVLGLRNVATVTRLVARHRQTSGRGE